MPRRQVPQPKTVSLIDDEKSPSCPGYPGVCGNFCNKNEGCHVGNQNLLPCGLPK